MIYRIAILFSLFVLLDFYVWMGTRNAFGNGNLNTFYKWFFWVSSAISYVGFAVLFIVFRDRSTSPVIWQNFLMGFAFTFFVFKLLTGIFLVIDDLIRFFQYIIESLSSLFSSKSAKDVDLHDRRRFIVQTGIILASIPFASMLFGITKGKYWYKLKNVKLNYKNLPSAFRGLKVIHISDVHSGSFDSYDDVARGIKMINDQNPDLILFTGDLVNNKADEIVPYISLFHGLKAKYGKFSTLGNHDYGDYVKWESDAAKAQNMQDLYENHKSMGFDLLNNENRKIQIEDSHINLAGVENWGRPPFPQHGDLNKALTGIAPEEFKILMSHDPSHWDLEVLKHDCPVELTLSGHTHGMQFGIEIPGWKWSPVKYVYKNWAGLYEKMNQKLYVNRGFGFLGFPGRVGMWPEITVIELDNESAEA